MSTQGSDGVGIARPVAHTIATITMGLCFLLVEVGGLILPLPLSWAESAESPGNDDLTDLSLEELMDVEVTSVSKKSQKLSEAAAAIFVISQEDIRRSGHTSIPEILRMAPGLQVAHLTGNKWAIAARGFNGQFTNKLLILIDGRSVYSPLFAGVYWDVQDILLEDVDRIEVIRGSGGTLWGANAVNGVINIVTKRAQDTQGGLATVTGGNLEQGTVGVRYGGKFGDSGAYRVYGKYFNRNNFILPSGMAAFDAWDQGRVGFRTDFETSGNNRFTIQGDTYDGEAEQTISTTTFIPPASVTVADRLKVRGGNVLLRWTHLFSATSDVTVQFYYDRVERQEATIGINRDTIDLDVQHKFSMAQSHDVVWGFGYRLNHDNITNMQTISLAPNTFDFNIVNAFVQDEFTIIPNALRLTLGTKVSYNTFTDFEFQPNVRVAWNPWERHTIWGSVSRAVRLPSRIERAGRTNVTAFPGFGTTAVGIISNSNFRSEEVIAYEVGYRGIIVPTVSVDIATFYNVYHHLLTTDSVASFTETAFGSTHTVVPSQYGNNMNGRTYGVEVATKWKVNNQWTLLANYTWLRLEFNLDASSVDFVSQLKTGNNPKQQLYLRSTYNFPYNIELDNGLYYVSSLQNLGISGYVRVDARLGWRPTDSLEISVVGQNLFDNQHPEFTGGTGVGGASTGGITPSEVPRSGYVKVTAWF